MSEQELTTEDSCGKWIEGRFQSNDERRGKSMTLHYRLYLPPDAGNVQSMPLLVMLHGCHQDASVFAAGTRMNAVAARRGFAVLYPEQSRAVNAMRCWNWFHSVSLDGGGEAAAIAELSDDVAGRYALDRARIYIAGMSAGGAMAHIVAVRYSNLFAACAVHSGVMFNAATTLMQALATLRSGSKASPNATVAMLDDVAGLSRSFVPTLVIHGDSDDSVSPINAAQIVQQCRVLLSSCARAISLSGPHEREVSSAGRRYVVRDYIGEGRVLIRDVNVHGMGHAWSGGDARHPFNDPAGPCASELIGDFLSLHRREVAMRAAKPHVAAPTHRVVAADTSGGSLLVRLHEMLRKFRHRP